MGHPPAAPLPPAVAENFQEAGASLEHGNMRSNAKRLHPDCMLFLEVTPHYMSDNQRTTISTAIGEIDHDSQGIRHSVVISEEEWERLAAIERRNTLIGRFGRKRPDLEQVRAELRTNLGDVQIGSLNERMILLRFSSEEDYRKVLMRDRLVVGGVSVWLARWSPSWNP